MIRGRRRPWWRSYYPGWVVSGGGGGGGAATVQSDGVTLQGDGSGGSKLAIKAVQTDATLTGAGTVASPLSAAQQTPTGWPLTFFQFGVPAGAMGTTANSTLYFGFFLPCQVKFNHIQFGVFVADGAHLYDVGIYNAAGTLLADIGPQALASANFPLNIATVQGTVTLNPGRYAIAYTGNSNGVTFYGASSQWGWCSSLGSDATVGGQLNASITAPTFPTTDNHSMAFGLYFV